MRKKSKEDNLQRMAELRDTDFGQITPIDMIELDVYMITYKRTEIGIESKTEWLMRPPKKKGNKGPGEKTKKVTAGLVGTNKHCLLEKKVEVVNIIDSDGEQKEGVNKPSEKEQEKTND